MVIEITISHKLLSNSIKESKEYVPKEIKELV